jgi:hypothetical protein
MKLSPAAQAIQAAGSRFYEARLDYPPLSRSAELVIKARRKIMEGETYRLVQRHGVWACVTEDEYQAIYAKQPAKRTLGEMLRTSELLLLTEGTRH